MLVVITFFVILFCSKVLVVVCCFGSSFPKRGCTPLIISKVTYFRKLSKSIITYPLKGMSSEKNKKTRQGGCNFKEAEKQQKKSVSISSKHSFFAVFPISFSSAPCGSHRLPALPVPHRLLRYRLDERACL